MKNNFFILSGCSGGGKSTLLALLQKKGFRVMEEPGRKIVRHLRATGGSSLPSSDPDAFLELALAHYIRDYLKESEHKKPVFFDRGIPDAIQPARNQPPHFMKAGLRYRYNKTVFMLPPWKEIYQNDPERSHSFANALSEYESLLKSYGNLGYDLIFVPKLAPDKRAEFILGHMEKMMPAISGKIPEFAKNPAAPDTF